MSIKKIAVLLSGFLCVIPLIASAATLNLSNVPLFLTQTVPPLMMLVLSKDHKLFTAAYNDASSLDNTGILSIGYQGYPGRLPAPIEYYGYFDSYKCYTYSSGVFTPVSVTSDKTCTGQWSGDWLNYITTSRIDALRKVLYGGYRSTDSSSSTILERAYIPQDAHNWGRQYTSIAVDGYDISKFTPLSVPSSGRKHFFLNVTIGGTTNAPLMRTLTNVASPYSIIDWSGKDSPQAGTSMGLPPNASTSISPTDYTIRVKVCLPTLLETNCKYYAGSGVYKPTGILQNYGSNDQIYFGLITGSYEKNLSGGVLRKNVSSITNEINSSDGTFNSTVGIIKTINKLTIVNFDSSGLSYSDCNSNAAFNSPLSSNEGTCENWGAPISEMMYESLRYFAGKSSPTSSFNYGSGTTDATLGLPKPSWVDPYSASGGNYPSCSKPIMLVIGDNAPSYDSDQLPGTYFGSFTGDLSTMNVSTLSQTIWDQEVGGSKTVMIGQSGTAKDYAPTPKTVTSFGNIRGLPGETAKEGSYYAGAVAYYGHTNLANTKSTETVDTYIMTFSQPITSIPINVNGSTIYFLPYARSINWPGSSIINPASTSFQPVQEITNITIISYTPTSGIIQVNFNDSDRGFDYDADNVVQYSWTVSGSTLTMTITSVYGAQAITSHNGFAITGTNNKDGAYLAIRGYATSGANDNVRYYLDTPAGSPSPPANTWATETLPLPLTATYTFTPGTSSAIVLNDPLWYAAKWGGFKDRNSNNKPDLDAEWSTITTGQPDNFFYANSLNLIDVQLNLLFAKVLADVGSSSSASVNSSSLNSSTLLYQARFNSGDWSGEFLAYRIDSSGQLDRTGSGPYGSQWDAGLLITAQNWDSGRNIITYSRNSNAGVPFRWSNIGTTNQGYLNINPATLATDTQGSSRLNYLRGQRDNEQQYSGLFRNRVKLLGDIVNSTPAFVPGKPAFPYEGFTWSPAATAPENSATVNYAQFKANYANRSPVLYAGANDGMLHFLNPTTGAELMAYVPSFIMQNMNKLTNPSYSHIYYVDGSPVIADAYFSTAAKWQTVLVSGVNGGGRGMFALNVTDPTLYTNESNASSIVLWEYDRTKDVDVGYTFGQPSIVRMQNGKWAAIFGNGYNSTVSDGYTSTTGNAVLFIVDLETGTLIKKIDTGKGMTADPLGLSRPNGLSSPAVADGNGDFIANAIYAGDLYGNLWKFDVSNSDPTQWKVANSGSPLFVAKDASNNPQAITSRPSLSIDPRNPLTTQIFFGTGKYLEVADKSPNLTITHSFYAIYDSGSTVSGRSVLQQQTILAEQSVTDTNGVLNNVRITSNNTLDATKKGWYIDLKVSGGSNTGEMVVTNSILRDNKIIFTTIIPSSDVCSSGGIGWLMELNKDGGGRLNYSPFDLNGDKKFSTADNVTYMSASYPASGLQSMAGIPQPPSILSTPTTEYKYSTTSAGTLNVVTENPGQTKVGRRSWMQNIPQN